MREVVLRVPRLAVEDILDRLLPIVPGGVREVQVERHIELKMRGADVPPTPAIAEAVGRWPHTLREQEVPDDWRERRVADYVPDLIGGRLVVRPEWAPPSPDAAIEIVLADSPAFGGGTHPTTRTCLELLLELEPLGAFADLGCGTGVLAILAARLGWAAVSALDIEPTSIEATSRSAEHNGATIDARVADLSAERCPEARGLAANVPSALHELIVAALPEPVPDVALLSGFGPDDAERVAGAYGARGLWERRRVDRLGWTVLVLERA
jgi:ribosomal protein L11 methyltransferase